jgi:hypothetical protein
LRGTIPSLFAPWGPPLDFKSMEARFHQPRCQNVDIPRFEEVKTYVRDGLPVQHFLRKDGEVVDQRKWLDSHHCSYEGYPPTILYSARFRDGLVADGEVYSRFIEDRAYTYWVDAFFKHSQIVFDYLIAQNKISLCTGTCHNYIEKHFETISGHKGSMCLSALCRGTFLNYCMKNIKGYQCHSLMRGKLFAVVGLEVQKLPKCWSQNHGRADIQMKWLHAIQASLFCLYHNDLLLTFKFYGEDDLDWLFEELIPRFKQAMSHLRKDDVFNSPENCNVLITLLVLMQNIEIEYSSLRLYICSKERKSLFGPLIESYTPLAEALYEEHHDTSQTISLDLTIDCDQN